MIKLPMVFQNNMVLQTGEPVSIFGTTDQKTVKVSIQGKQAEASADPETGRFVCEIGPLSVSLSETLVISDGDSETVIENVAVGEVWLLGGQSNMEFYMYHEKHMKEAVPGEGKVRLYYSPEIVCDEQLTDFDYSDYGVWRKDDTIADIEFFSAVGYYFGKVLEKELNCPIGLVVCNWGGTPAVSWLNAEKLRGTRAEIWLNDYEKAFAESGKTERQLIDEYRVSPLASGRAKQIRVPFDRVMFGLTHAQQEENMKQMMARMPKREPGAPAPRMPLSYLRKPGLLYDFMLRKIAPYTVKGALWYQGESDSDRADLYDIMMRAVIDSWREMFGKDFPFYIVQLAPFGKWMTGYGTHYEVVRKLQEQVADECPDTYMVSIMDGGMLWDIHPKDKKIPGERLGRLALKETYRKQILAGSPRPVTDKILTEDGKITVPMTDAEGGLTKKFGPYIGHELEVFVDGKPEITWEGTVEGDAIVVESPFFAAGHHITLKYAESMYARVDIYSQADFTVRPFTVEIDM